MRRVTGTGAKVDVDVLNTVSGDNHELGVTGLPIRARIADWMSQLNPQPEVFECDAMKIHSPPFLHGGDLSASPKCPTCYSPPKCAEGSTYAWTKHMRGIETLTHRSLYNGRKPLKTDRRHTTPTNGHDPPELAIALGIPGGTYRAM